MGLCLTASRSRVADLIRRSYDERAILSSRRRLLAPHNPRRGRRTRSRSLTFRHQRCARPHVLGRWSPNPGKLVSETALRASGGLLERRQRVVRGSPPPRIGRSRMPPSGMAWELAVVSLAAGRRPTGWRCASRKLTLHIARNTRGCLDAPGQLDRDRCRHCARCSTAMRSISTTPLPESPTIR